MGDIWKAKFGLGTFFTAIMVTLSYEVKIANLNVPPFFLILFSFIISGYFANFVIDKSLGWRFGRRFVMGKAWIEGHWLLSTTTIENNPNSISQLGLCYISYEGDSQSLSVVTYRKKINNNMHTGFSSISELVSIRSYDLRFSNIFALSNGTIDTKGVTVGKFITDRGKTIPTRFEGHVTLFNEGINRRQSGTKISEKEIRKYIKNHQDNWKDEMLKYYENQANSNT